MLVLATGGRHESLSFSSHHRDSERSMMLRSTTEIACPWGDLRPINGPLGGSTVRFRRRI